jgi:hypothetical protein
MMTVQDLESELKGFFAEYAAAEQMTEDAIQSEYNTDETKAEFLEFLQSEIDRLQALYDTAKEEEEAEERRDWRTAGLDPAFGSWQEVNLMFI